jgi:Holliday junction resolvase RusA-like endonuclease
MIEIQKHQIIKGNVPSKSNCYKIITLNGHGSLAKTKTLKSYEESFMWQCGKYRNANISVPFEFHVDVYYPSKRSDIDNAMKILLDCLQKVKAISNDNLCMKIVAQKFIDKNNPRVEFRIIEF